MKSIMLIVLLVILSIPVWGQTLNNPESVVISYHDDGMPSRLYISNSGNGQILKTSFSLSTYTVFASGLGSVRGLCITNNILYAASDLGLARYDLITELSIGTVEIPGSVFLNDVVADSSGNIYISDTQAHKIFKYNVAEGIVSTLVNAGIQNPNGMVFDAKNNRILLVSFRANSPIQSIQLPDGSVSTILNTSIGNLDGIGFDDNGVIYFSSWETNSIYRLTSLTANPIPIWTGLSGPADFSFGTTCFNDPHFYRAYPFIFIPNMNSNEIIRYEVPNLIKQFQGFSTYSNEYHWCYSANWRVTDEVSLRGFYLYISSIYDTLNINNAFCISNLIPPNDFGTYSFSDYGCYYTDYWWIKLVETDSTEHVFGPFSSYNIVGSEDQTSIPAINDISFNPNPVTSNSVLTFALSKDDNAEVSIYDAKGRKVCHKSLGFLKSGKHEISLSALGFQVNVVANGIYFVKLKSGGKQIYRKLIVKK